MKNKVQLKIIYKLAILSLLSVNLNAFNVNKIAKELYKEVKIIVKGHPNYRETALKNAKIKRGGWIQDPYTGKFYRAKDMDADHIWPRKYGGTNHSWNLQMLSKTTNRSKGAKIDRRIPIGYYRKLQQFAGSK
jgi:5-methylcytosine-specific restriction endonuclease McrA